MEEREQYVCPLDRSSVCARWTNYYDNEIVNISYLCTKISIAGEGAMKKGCMTHYKDTYSTEVCACRTLSPFVIPCNYASHLTFTGPLLAVLHLATSILRALHSYCLLN
ncbi:hypothetical protein C0J52_21303 [Blattella germanica]|nr:hypothetical protein C0J52_21303 [Blattella germanica]